MGKTRGETLALSQGGVGGEPARVSNIVASKNSLNIGKLVVC